MFKSFWGSPEQEAHSRPQEIPTDSWYPPSVVSSQNSSQPATPSSSSSNNFTHRPGDRLQSSSHVSSAEACTELRKLLSDKDAYHQLLLSLDMVKTQNSVRDELRNETLQLSRENLEKESYLMELRNQCRIIWTTELATAQEKLNELERQKAEIMKFYSPASLLHQLQEAMNKTQEESKTLYRQLLDKESDVPAFVQKYKWLRNTHHKRALTHLAAKTFLTS